MHERRSEQLFSCESTENKTISLNGRSRAPDELDARILELLFQNARLPIAELARAIGLSSPSTAERVRRLEDNGVIEGYTIRVNPEKLGLTLPICLRIRPVPGELKQVEQVLNAIPEIIDCERVTGDDCFIARAHVRSVRDMERIIDKLTPIAMTNTSIIQSSPVRSRLPAFASSVETE